ncbi:MAG: hypothetical protein AAF415_15095 [Pseudomonadota bacterium]
MEKANAILGTSGGVVFGKGETLSTFGADGALSVMSGKSVGIQLDATGGALNDDGISAKFGTTGGHLFYRRKNGAAGLAAEGSVFEGASALSVGVDGVYFLNDFNLSGAMSTCSAPGRSTTACCWGRAAPDTSWATIWRCR